MDLKSILLARTWYRTLISAIWHSHRWEISMTNAALDSPTTRRSYLLWVRSYEARSGNHSPTSTEQGFVVLLRAIRVAASVILSLKNLIA